MQQSTPARKPVKRAKPTATLATSLPLEEQSPCPSSVLPNSFPSLQLPRALCWMMGNRCFRPGHLFVGHGAINTLQEEKKNSIFGFFFFFYFPSAAGAQHEEIKHLQENTSVATMLTPCPGTASEAGPHQHRPAEALSVCKPPKPRAPAQRSSANPTPQSRLYWAFMKGKEDEAADPGGRVTSSLT